MTITGSVKVCKFHIALLECKQTEYADAAASFVC